MTFFIADWRCTITKKIGNKMTGCEKTYNVALGVGANLGNPEQSIRDAAVLLTNAGLENLAISPLYTTAPINCIHGTPDFINCAFIGQFAGNPCELLEICQHIETKLGRPTIHSSNEARIIDLDILLFGDQLIKLENLTIPHPRMTERYFVLAPLKDLAPKWTVPNHGTVEDLFSKLK